MATPTSNSTQITFFNEPADSIVASIVDDSKWGGLAGTGVTLSYSFPGASPGFEADYSDLNEWGENDVTIEYSPLNASQKLAFTSALETWANVSNITFVEFEDNASIVGEIRVALSSVVDTEDASAYAYSIDNFPGAGDIWLNPVVFTPSTSLETDTFEFNTLIHEIGHAINLKHPFDPGFSWDTTLPSTLDHIFNTIMSYTEDPTGNDFIASRYPSTPMVLDIEAIQFVYGANESYNAGDDVYFFDSDGEYLETIWDAGGIDTIVYTGSADGKIDLREGKASSLGKPVDLINPNGGAIAGQVDTTVWVATNAEIENATANSGNNKIIGNTLNNILIGNEGKDILKGGGGDDNLSGDNGADKLNGGGGNDILAGGNGSDNLNGKAGDDVLYGEAGNDILRGHLGVDLLDGGEGSDTYRVSIAEEVSDIYTDSGTGGGDIDTLDGSLVEDVVLSSIFSAGSTGLEVILGEKTRLLGSNEAVNWDFSGLSLNGIKELRTSNEDDVVIGSDGNDKIRGIDGDDSLSGGIGDDKLFGGSDNDTLDGGAGEDRLVAGSGSDLLNGGNGDDVLKGGNGADIFIFDTNLQASNIDFITDFVSSEDMIALDDDIFTSLTSLAGSSLSVAEFVSNATGIAADADDRIVYNNTTGELFYDEDGAEGDAAILFALLKNAPSIEAADFIVIA
ncbi:MAG: serralysin [Gammaproteobacteria bacterium]|jgi:serralysin